MYSTCNNTADSKHLAVRPAMTQISLGIRPIWSESSLSAHWVAKDLRFLHADNEDWSDWADAQADLSFRWAHTHFVGFVMSRLSFDVLFLFLLDVYDTVPNLIEIS